MYARYSFSYGQWMGDVITCAFLIITIYLNILEYIVVESLSDKSFLLFSVEVHVSLVGVHYSAFTWRNLELKLPVSESVENFSST